MTWPPPERILIVAAGGALGTLARYFAALQWGAHWVTTLSVNLSGSFLIGLLFAVTSDSQPRIRLALATGFLGGYTTFSAWQLEALLEAHKGDVARTIVILTISTAAGFISVTLGALLGSRILRFVGLLTQ
ncbi:MAG: CrcB family protein [Bryobacteraceae bacterium]|nr:CrcB family protein [Bryobacteraceae bacterium]